MRVEGIDPAELMSSMYYLDAETLNQLLGTNGTIDPTTGKPIQQTQQTTTPTDPQSQINLLQLDNSGNKLMILNLLSVSNVMSLVSKLNKEQLLDAMELFPQDKLVQFIAVMPMEMILKLLLQFIPLDQLLKYMPMQTVSDLLKSKGLMTQDIVKNFKEVPVQTLQQIMGNITQQNMENVQQRDLMTMFYKMDKNRILDGMQIMPQKQMLQYVTQVVQKDPDLLTQLPQDKVMNVVQNMTKPSLLQMFALLPQDMLVPYVSQLPSNLLTTAVSQIDGNTLGNILVNQYPGLVSNLLAS